MLALITIFIASLLTAIVSIWLYRIVSSWKRFDSAEVVRPGITKGSKLRPQHGFVSLKGVMSKMAPAQPAKSVKLRNSNSSIKAPWGW